MDEARRTLKRALSVVETSGDCSWESDLYRLDGELLFLLNSNPTQVEDSLRTAIEIAIRQRSKSLELNAGTNLARLWRDQGKRTEAHDLLAPPKASTRLSWHDTKFR